MLNIIAGLIVLIPCVAIACNEHVESSELWKFDTNFHFLLSQSTYIPIIISPYAHDMMCIFSANALERLVNTLPSCDKGSALWSLFQTYWTLDLIVSMSYEGILEIDCCSHRLGDKNERLDFNVRLNLPWSCWILFFGRLSWLCI